MGNISVENSNTEQRVAKCNSKNFYANWMKDRPDSIFVYSKPGYAYDNNYMDFYEKDLSTSPPPVITEDDKKDSLANPLLSKFKKDLSVKEVTLKNGVKVNTTLLTKFEGMQEEMLNLFKYMAQAARELGLTFTLSEVSRTVATSNRAHAGNSSMVAAGGKSPHNYGAAVDICLFCDGKSVVATSPIQKKFADRVIELSNNTVTWGGYYKRDCNGPNRKGTGEEHHFELTNWEKKYKNKENLITKIQG